MDDLISRQAALNWCTPEDWGTPDERWRPESEYGAMLEALPSAQPERKRGRWIHKNDDLYDWYRWLECSECGYEVDYGNETNYCPNCGAEMEGEDDETD